MATIDIPSTYSEPQYQFEQQVYIKHSDNTRGKIIGLHYAYDTWYYAVYVPHIGSRNDWYDENELTLDPRDDEDYNAYRNAGGNLHYEAWAATWRELNELYCQAQWPSFVPTQERSTRIADLERIVKLEALASEATNARAQ